MRTLAGMITYYGIKNCDTVKRARTALQDHGIDARFHDFRADGIDMALASDMVAALGAKVVVNTRGTTWRGLSDTDKARADSDPAGLIAEFPALIKRPVWRKGDAWRIGFAKRDEADMLAWLKG